MPIGYDFCGWATKNNLLCSDGRTIRRGAFKEADGQTVPLVYQHQHNSVENVLGHAILENRDEGIYAYGYLNDTLSGQVAKELLRHGDVRALSIYANKLKCIGNDVIHGSIREVSLVLAGANPGAAIESVVLEHADGSSEEEAIIYTGEDEIYDIARHADDERSSEKTVMDVYNSMTKEKKDVLAYMIGTITGDEDDDDMEDEEEYDDENVTHADSEDDGPTMREIFENDFTDEEKRVAYYLIGKAIEEADSVKYSDIDNYYDGGNATMKRNVFDRTNDESREEVLSHAEIQSAMDDGKKYGSLKASFIAHGIEDIEYMFPDAKAMNVPPEFIKRDDSWVKKVMNGVHHTPFSRVKTLLADITEDEARAKGYIKGKLKKDEVFSLLKRTTEPTTIYKKQKIDRDDMIDITDFDVIPWLKSEMRTMLEEECARAILVGDGRLASSDDKIPEDHIRPIWTDSDLYTVKVRVQTAANATDDQKAKAIIRAIIKARKNYKGSGNPTFYTTEDVLTDLLLLEDANGRAIYDTETKLATALRVKEIVTVPVMENLKRTVTEGLNTTTLNLIGIIVNPTDYNVGADRGGAVSMFDDFDIDYNAMKYLIETRFSGALTKPYSAMAIEAVGETNTSGTGG